MSKQRLLPLLLCFLCFPHISHANQTNPFENNSNVNNIIQDNDGFIWLAGQNGLVRYDGENTVNFSSNNKNWSLPSNWIHRIAKIDEQFVLSTESSGILAFDPKTGLIQTINIASQTDSFYRGLYHQGLYYALSTNPDNIYSYDPITFETKIIAEHIDYNDLFNTLNNVYFTDNNELYQIKEGKPLRALTGKVSAVAAIKNTAIIAMNNSI